MDNQENMAEKIAAAEHQLRQLKANMIDGHIAVILLDLQIAIRKAYPDTVDVNPVARKIVAYLREHVVAE